jgi:hypothetical protein
MSTYNLIFDRFVPLSKVEKRPYRYAAFVGSSIGVMSAVLGTLAIALIVAILPREMLGQSAAAGLSKVGTAGLFLLAVLLIPFWETFIGQLLPIEVARGLGLSEKSCIAVGAVIFAGGHYLNGGLAHGLCAAIGGALFSTGYVSMRSWGYFPAFFASYFAHVTNNFVVLYAVPLIFPEAA